MKDPVAIYRELFPKAPCNFVYQDKIRKHVKDCDLWRQILEEEKYRCRFHKTNPYPLPFLIKAYKRAEQQWREIETPKDHNPAYDLQGRGEPVDFKAALEPLTDEKRAKMLRLWQEEADRVYSENKYWQNRTTRADA